jgi:antibiotic biosynthesis monooxygenase (ABM) superfamily enzyme
MTNLKRRTYLASVVSLLGVAFAPAQTSAPVGHHSIALHVDLQVDPAKEKEMLRVFHGKFHAAAAKQPGFISANMIKLRSALQGAAPPNSNYRFVLQFETEEQRQAWVASSIHQQLWPMIEATLVSKQYTVLLYDMA